MLAFINVLLQILLVNAYQNLQGFQFMKSLNFWYFLLFLIEKLIFKIEPRNVVAEVNSSVLFECKVTGEVCLKI